MKILSSFITCTLFLLFVSCNENQSQKDIAANYSDSSAGFAGDPVKIVKTGSINFKVNDAYKSARAVSQLAQGLGGIISHQNIESSQDQSKELKISDDSILVVSAYTTRAEITARIPSRHLEEFIDSVANLASFISGSKMDIDDKGLEYLAAQLRQENRIDVLSRAGNQQLTNRGSQLLIDQKDVVNEQEIAKRQIDAQVRYSTVQLSLVQNPSIKKEVIANYAIADYHLPFGKNLQHAFVTGWEYFLNFVVAITHFWMLLILGIGVWFLFKYSNQKIRVVKTSQQVNRDT